MGLVLTALSLWCNWRFLLWCSLPKILKMNDVPSILHGFHQTPNLWPDSLQWWRGTWIQSGIPAFRPLASYLYWVESWVGLRLGFVWVGWFGFALFLVTCALTAVLAWRLCRSKLCVALACVLAPAISYHNSQPDYWLAWYPVHQELAVIIFVLGALICFDVWYESGAKNYLLGAWALFGLGCLTKEYGYIFPAFALAVVMLRPSTRVSRREGLMQAGLMLAAVLALWCYRAWAIENPRNPPMLKRIMLIRRPFLFFFYPFYLSVLTEQFWFPGLAVLLLAMGAAWLRWRATPRGQAWLARPWSWLPLAALALAILALYCTLTYSLGAAFWYLFEPTSRGARMLELGAMMGTLYSVYLLGKHCTREATLAAFAFVILSYAPAFTFLGWHYTIPGWFFRSAYWPLVAKLVWIELGRPPLSFPARLLPARQASNAS